MEEIIEAKRELGNGRWDKILKRKMVELSFADNYEEAKEEWEATGRAYKHTHYNNEPDWVTEIGHIGFCLCGHRIVYHFEILNSVTGVREIVGSDHIGAYLIIKQIIQETGFTADSITDAMVADWLKNKVQTMKAQAWWEENGGHFQDMFNAIKDIDVAVNIKEKQLAMVNNDYVYNYTLKKRASGKFGDYGYQMASIVWRWNHPDNPKTQEIKYGYPNDRLWSDINLFYALRTQHQEVLDADNKVIAQYQRQRKEQLEREKKRAEEYRERRRQQQIAWEAGAEQRRLDKIEREKQIRKSQEIAKKRKDEHYKKILLEESEHLDNLYDYYGMSPINLEEVLKRNLSSADMRSLVVIKEILMSEGRLRVEAAHFRTLKRILGKE